MKLNVNKVFPRLTISAKLAVAFVAIAAAPLAVVAALATGGAIRQLRETASATLAHDLELASLGVTRSLREAEQHLAFLTNAFGRPLLLDDPGPRGTTAATTLVDTFLRSDSSAILRARVLDMDGAALLDAGPLNRRNAPGDGDRGAEYYLLQAENLDPGQRQAFLPIELLDPRRGGEHGLVVIPAVAVLRPIRNRLGAMVGVVVVEASAQTLFSGIEVASPNLSGTTGLIDENGFTLYHTRWKRDWQSLLGRAEGMSLASEFGPVVAEGMLSGETGTLPGPAHTLVSFRTLDLGPEAPLMTLYRSIPLGAVDASAWDFLRLTTYLGFAILLAVLAASVVAARQLTKPIYRLQGAARRLAAGASSGRLEIETNDELEDLARDFRSMAQTLDWQRRQLEAQVEDRTRDLTRTRAHLEDVVSNARDAIIGLDEQDRVVLWSAGAEALFEYPESDALGARLDSLIACAGEKWEHERLYLARAVRDNGGVNGLRTVRRTRSGEQITVSLTQSRIVHEDGTGAGSSLIIRDYRAQARLEEQMRRSERLAAVSIMAAGLAHEINNPLAILGNRIELMQRDAARQEGGEAFQKDLEVLGRHVERIRSLTTDLLAFAREDDGEPSPVDLGQVVARVVRLLDKTFRTNGVQLHFDEPGILPLVEGNEKALETVFVNLLLNAGQATPSGGRVAVRVEASPDGRAVTGRVQDTGPGVPAELRARIFEPFFTTKSKDGGTGLGLVVCRTIAERHGGRLRLEEPGEGGAAFVFEVPTKQGAE